MAAALLAVLVWDAPGTSTFHPLSARPAHAEDLGRGALGIGLAWMPDGPVNVEPAGLHIGWESAYQFGLLGPMMSVSYDRFSSRLGGAPEHGLFSLGGGLRGFGLLSRAFPLAVYLEGQGILLGATQPLGRDSTFVGLSAGLGVEYASGLNFALTTRLISLMDGPTILQFSLTVGLGAP